MLSLMKQTNKLVGTALSHLLSLLLLVKEDKYYF
jgi:hypothetical protein